MRGRQIAKLFFHKIENLLVGDISRGGDEEMIGGEPVLEASAQGFAFEGANTVWCAEDRTAE